MIVAAVGIGVRNPRWPSTAQTVSGSGIVCGEGVCESYTFGVEHFGGRIFTRRAPRGGPQKVLAACPWTGKTIAERRPEVDQKTQVANSRRWSRSLYSACCGVSRRRAPPCVSCLLPRRASGRNHTFHCHSRSGAFVGAMAPPRQPLSALTPVLEYGLEVKTRHGAS